MLSKNEIHVFWGFLSLQKKWNSCFLRFFKLAKNTIHAFWDVLSLQKIKFMFFELSKFAKNEIHVSELFLASKKGK